MGSHELSCLVFFSETDNVVKRIYFVAIFFILLALLATVASLCKRSDEQCLVDGNDIIPVTRVEIEVPGGGKKIFCSVCCARTWLDRNPEVVSKLHDSSAGLIVVDEVSGIPIDGSLAYWIASDQYSRLENKCRIHVFKEKADASRHLRNFHGREMVGYLAGVGRQLPWAADFIADDLTGRKHHLHEYRGSVVFLRFWSSVNPFAEMDLTNLQQAYDRFKQHGFIVVAVNVEQDLKTVRQFVDKLHLNYPIVLDTDGKIADQYGITGYPTGFLLDRAGIVQSSSVGEISADLMKPLLYPLL